MRTKLLFLGLILCAAGALLALPGRADIGPLQNAGPLATPGATVVLPHLVGQTTCNGQAVAPSASPSASPGPIDVEGSTDGAHWTALKVSVLAVATSQPFTPVAGQLFVFPSNSTASVRVRADATWSGQTTVVTIRCTASTARVDSAPLDEDRIVGKRIRAH